MKKASVAMKGLVAEKCAIRALAERTLGKRVDRKLDGGGYPIPGILQSVRKSLISKVLGETSAFKCEASVRKRLISKELRQTFTLRCELGEKSPLPFGRGKKELEEE
jgi:hypothetical protein